MAIWLKQSTAVTVKLGPFLDETDGKTAETALTLSQADIRLAKNGGDIAQKNNASACTHDELGYYDCPLSTTDTNTLGVLKLMVHESGALPVWQEFMVVPANVWDSLFGADRLQVHADEITAGLITSTALADNAIAAAKIASGAITAAKFASGAIDATALAADAGAEIADAVWDEALSGHTAAGSAGKALADASPGVIADAVWDEALSGHTAAGSAGKKLGDMTNSDPWATAVPGSYGAGTAGKILGDKSFNASQIGGSTAAATAAGKSFQGIAYGTAVTGTLTTTAFTTNLTETTDEHYKSRTVTFISGPLKDQQATIVDYVGATKTLVVTAMTEAPANGNEFFIA